MGAIHYRPRAPGKNQMMIESIKNEFDAGAKLVEIKTDNAFRLRKKLYNLSKEQGLLWRFATTSGSVFISNPVTFPSG